MYIDPHVHCRDWNQSHKETVAHALKVAEGVGINAVFDMPNTSPPIISTGLVMQRLDLAEKVNSPVFYGLYIGLTARPSQIEEAVTLYHKFFPRVVGLKLFAGKSVGDLAVTEELAQDLVYNTLAGLNYNGMLVVHCEKESLMKPELWDPKKPKTHCYARPPEAEVESVKDQIKYAVLNGFKGNLHITHVSVPETVELVRDARKKIRISCGATPHHCLLNDDIMDSSQGILYKMNPPLRDAKSASQNLEYLRDGLIDYLESDHAPHTLEEKINHPYLSGIPNLPFVPDILKQLRKEGFSEKRIKEITCARIKELFRIDIPERKLRVEGDFSKDYTFNPYQHLK